MSSVNEKMSGLANKIREVNGSTLKLGIDLMTEEIESINKKIKSESEIIEEIYATLEDDSLVSNEKSQIENNIVNLQNALNLIRDSLENNKNLPELINEGQPWELLSNKELINSQGEIIVGTMEDIGELNLTFDADETSSYTLPTGFINGGNISIISIIYMYYNDLKLPKIPTDSKKSYPYFWIRDNGSTGNYDLIMGTTSFYYDSANTRLKHRGSDTDLWYRLPKSTASNATSWGSPVSHSYVGWTIDANRPAFWSNHDVTKGESSTEIYLAGSEPVPVV